MQRADCALDSLWCVSMCFVEDVVRQSNYRFLLGCNNNEDAGHSRHIVIVASVISLKKERVGVLCR